MTTALTIQHLGRVSRAHFTATDGQIKKLRNALLIKEFRVVSETADSWKLRRRAYVMQDDWPVQVTISRSGRHEWQIDYALSVPWAWIISLCFLSIMVWPFAGVENAGLGFILALFILALALYQRTFDCRPHARFWQQRPRQRWGDFFERCIAETLAH